jgi:DNA replication protein DnaC
MTHEELVGSLAELRLNGMKQEYAEMARIAGKDNKTYEQYLSMLVGKELSVRQETKIRRLLKEARLPLIKDLESYDYSGVKGITAREVNRLATGEFLRKAQNIVFYGTFGVGKTHLAIALAKALCERKYRCLFISTSTLIEALLEAKNKLSIASMWKKMDTYDLIICDELGYLPQTKEGADLFFQFIAQRYERKSLLITTNLTYSEWDRVFINTTTTAAAVDRIIHKCETFNIESDSWRRREAVKAAKEKEAKD